MGVEGVGGGGVWDGVVDSEAGFWSGGAGGGERIGVDGSGYSGQERWLLSGK